MSRKSKGINAERDLVHKFNKVGWVAARIAGSGSSKYPCPDIIAGNNLRRMVIEVKTIAAHSKYFTIQEVEDLQLFAHTFGAEAWVAVRFQKEAWLFMPLHELTKKDKSYLLTLEHAQRSGLLFEELVR